MAQVIDRYQARTFSDALHMQAAIHPATAAQPVDVAQCVAEVVRTVKSNYSAPADPEIIDRAREWHALVAAVGD